MPRMTCGHARDAPDPCSVFHVSVRSAQSHTCIAVHACRSADKRYEHQHPSPTASSGSPNQRHCQLPTTSRVSWYVLAILIAACIRSAVSEAAHSVAALPGGHARRGRLARTLACPLHPGCTPTCTCTISPISNRSNPGVQPWPAVARTPGGVSAVSRRSTRHDRR